MKGNPPRSPFSKGANKRQGKEAPRIQRKRGEEIFYGEKPEEAKEIPLHPTLRKEET
jgi:hypothetical protein